MSLLEIKNLTKDFGGVRAVDKFSYRLERGGLYAIIGPNGAGKTTIFNLITGIYDPTTGHIFFQGDEITGLPTHQIAQKGIARTFQNIRLFSDFSVLDNVRTACDRYASYSIWEGLIPTPRRRREEKDLSERAWRLLDLVDLRDRAHELSKNLPYGHQRRLEIARALAQEPTLLLLDEPAAGMNPDETVQLIDFIEQIHEQFELTILLIEHHMEVVMGLADDIMVIDFGRTIAQGTPEEVQADPVVIEAYLGTEEEI
ncbi:MAG: high-affinity branched-chain amino acid ABC transporter ATP-binding protein LivG [Chloroflexi bacterium]|nr:MAG: high-affinity branched-chain amino acid ABC transporter ATP-binding protein LivG [Chloroflexota bacterium]